MVEAASKSCQSFETRVRRNGARGVARCAEAPELPHAPVGTELIGEAMLDADEEALALTSDKYVYLTLHDCAMQCN